MAPRVLVIYATTDGQTAKIARHIATALRDRVETVTLVNAATDQMADPEHYSAVIVAASVHARRFQKSIRKWARRHQHALAARPTAFIGVCLAAVKRSPSVDREIQTVFDGFARETGWTPAETKAVAGALKYTKYGWLKRWLLRRIVAKQGGDVDTSRDYEYTDWEDLRAFAIRFATGVTAAGVQPERRVPVNAGV